MHIRSMLAGLALVSSGLLIGCDDRAIEESLWIDLRDGAPRVIVETRLLEASKRTDDQAETIQQYLDRHLLGRDPWLRGFERSGAADVTIEYEGPPEAPSVIRRAGTLPGVESMVALMPDAIANFGLFTDAVHGTTTLEIIHIDAPEHVRSAGRVLGRELDRFASLGFEFSESVCDLYEYLEDNPDRRDSVLEAAEDGSEPSGAGLSGEEAHLVAAVSERAEPLFGFLLSDGQAAPVLSTSTFRPFDHDLVVRLPSEAIEAEGFVSRDVVVEAQQDGGSEEKADTGFAYAMEQVEAGDLLARIIPEAQPPLRWEGLELEEGESLRGAPFVCRRFDSPVEIRRLLWEAILPRPRYLLTWPTR